MSLQQKIDSDFLVAMKERKVDDLSILRMLKSAVQNRKIEKMIAKEIDLPDEDVISLIKSEVKQRRDSANTYQAGNRNDLAEKELSEVVFLEKYLPEQLSEEQIIVIIKETINELGVTSSADFGKVMGAAVKKAAGRADGQKLSAMIKEKLGKI